eukprot:6175746-Prorocentrum_lima.AAC.1
MAWEISTWGAQRPTLVVTCCFRSQKETQGMVGHHPKGEGTTRSKMICPWRTISNSTNGIQARLNIE